MKKQTFHFEISDLLVQFLAAFDQVVINRYDVNRVSGQKIQVRYVYAPKQRVLFDLTNPGQNLTLPVVAITMGSITRDDKRVFNKTAGFLTPGNIASDTNRDRTNFYRSPVPINISLKMSILTRYQTDLEQILSNFIPYNNPYIIISWKVPTDFNIAYTQEIRTEVIWGGDINIDYPIDINGGQKSQIVADTSFTIKGWLFPAAENSIGNIFKIDTDFSAVRSSEILEYGNYFSLSANHNKDKNSEFYTTDNIVVSGAPIISNVTPSI
jgi:hypothetical protein